jgi:hypothetical protein
MSGDLSGSSSSCAPAPPTRLSKPRPASVVLKPFGGFADPRPSLAQRLTGVSAADEHDLGDASVQRAGYHAVEEAVIHRLPGRGSAKPRTLRTLRIWSGPAAVFISASRESPTPRMTCSSHAKAPGGAMPGRVDSAQVDMGITQMMTLAGRDVTRA